MAKVLFKIVTKYIQVNGNVICVMEEVSKFIKRRDTDIRVILQMINIMDMEY